VGLHEEVVVRLTLRRKRLDEPGGAAPGEDEGVHPLLLLGGGSSDGQFYSVYGAEGVGWPKVTLWPGQAVELYLAFAPRSEGEHRGTVVLRTSFGSVMVEAEGRGDPSAGIVHPVGGLVGARSEERKAHVVGTVSVRNPGDSEAVRVNWGTLVAVGTAGTAALHQAAELEEAWGDFDEEVPTMVEQGLDNLLGRDSDMYHPYVAPGHKRDVLNVVASHGGRNGERLRGSVRLSVEVEGHERIFMVPLDVVFQRGCGGASVEPVLLGSICGGCPAGTLSGRGAGAGTAALVVRNAAVAGAGSPATALRVERILALPPRGPGAAGRVLLRDSGRGGFGAAWGGPPSGDYGVVGPGQNSSWWDLSFEYLEGQGGAGEGRLGAEGEGAEDGTPFSGEVHILLREVDGVFGGRSAWVAGTYSGTLLPAGTCKCGSGPEPGHSSSSPPALLTRNTCERQGAVPGAGEVVHMDFGASFPGARRTQVLTRVINAAHQAGNALPRARSNDPRFVPRVVGARAEGGMPQLELAVTLDPARGALSESYLGVVPAAGWGGGSSPQEELRESCMLYNAQSAMLHALEESGRAELAAEITIFTAPPQKVAAHAELVWPSIVRPAPHEAEPAPSQRTVDFGSLPFDVHTVRRVLEPTGFRDLTDLFLERQDYFQASREQWLRVDNPLPDRPLHVRLLDAREEGSARGLLDDGGCSGSHPLLPGGEWDGLRPKSVVIGEIAREIGGNRLEAFRTDPSHREAVYSAVVAPGESVNIGPILFQPLSKNNYSGYALVSNNLTGIEAVPLSGTGTEQLVSIVTDGQALRITEEEIRGAEATFRGQGNFGLQGQSRVVVRKALTLQNLRKAPLHISAVGLGGRSLCTVRGYVLENCRRKFTLQPGELIYLSMIVEWICEKPTEELELYMTERGRQPVKYVFTMPKHARCDASSKRTPAQTHQWNVGNHSARATLGVVGLAFIAMAALALLSQPVHATAVSNAIYGRASAQGAAVRGAPAQKGARARASARPEIDIDRLHAIRERNRGWLAYAKRYYARLGNYASTLLRAYAADYYDDALYYYKRIRYSREAEGISKGVLESKPALAKEGFSRCEELAGGGDQELRSRHGRGLEGAPGGQAPPPVQAPPLMEKSHEAGSAEGGALPKSQADQLRSGDAPSLAGVDSSLKLHVSPEESDAEEVGGEETSASSPQLAFAKYTQLHSPNSPLEREESMACKRLLHERVVRVLDLGGECTAWAASVKAHSAERSKGEGPVETLNLAGILGLCEAAFRAGPPKYCSADLLDLLKGVTLAAPWKPLEKGHRRDAMRQAVRRTVAVMCSSLLDLFNQYGRDEQILVSVLQAYARMFMNPSLHAEGAAEPLWDRVNALVEKEASRLSPDLIARVLSAFVFFDRDCGLSPPPGLLAALHDRVLAVAPQTSQGTWDKCRWALRTLGAGFEGPHGRVPRADDRATRVTRHPPAGDLIAPRQSRKPAPPEAKPGGGVQEKPLEKKSASARRRKEHNADQPPPTHRPAEGAESRSARAPNKAKRPAHNGPAAAQRPQGKASARRSAQQQQRNRPVSQQPAEKAHGAKRSPPPPAIPEILRALAPREGHRSAQPEQPLPVEMGDWPAPPRGRGGQQAGSRRSSMEAAGGRVRDTSHPWDVAVPETFGANGMGTGTVSVLESLDILGAPDTDGLKVQQQQPSRVPASLFSIWQDDRSVTTALGPVSTRLPTPGPGPTHQFSRDFSALPEGGGGAMATPAPSLGLQKLQDALDSRRDLTPGEEALRGSSGFPVDDLRNALPDHFNPMDAETFGTDPGQWEATWDASQRYSYNYE